MTSVAIGALRVNYFLAKGNLGSWNAIACMQGPYQPSGQGTGPVGTTRQSIHLDSARN